MAVAVHDGAVDEAVAFAVAARVPTGGPARRPRWAIPTDIAARELAAGLTVALATAVHRRACATAKGTGASTGQGSRRAKDAGCRQRAECASRDPAEKPPPAQVRRAPFDQVLHQLLLPFRSSEWKHPGHVTGCQLETLVVVDEPPAADDTVLADCDQVRRHADPVASGEATSRSPLLRRQFTETNFASILRAHQRRRLVLQP